MSIYEDIDKEFQNFISDKKPKPAGLLSNGSAADNSNGYDAMEKEMADMGYQRSNDNDSWGTVLKKIPLMAAGNTIANVGRFMTYGGKPSWMTDEEYDTYQRLSPEDRKAVNNGGMHNWVESLRMGDPEAPRSKEGANGDWAWESKKAMMDYGENLARENTGNYTPYTAKSFAQGVGGLLPSIAEMALMKRSGLFSPTQLQEAGATMVGAKAGQLASKIPIGAITRNADKAGLFATNLARNAMLSQVEAMPESFLEQSDAVQGYIEQAKYNGTYIPGKTEQEAIEVGKKVYADNMLLNTVTDSLQNAMMDQIAMGKGSAKRKLLKNMLYNAPQGGFTEGMQGIIPKNAAGEEWHLSDPDIGEAALIGAVTGGAPGALNLGLDYTANKYAERQLAKNVRNMGEGQDGTANNISSEPTEMLSDDEQQIVNGIRNVNDVNNPPPPPGTAAAAEEMMQRNGTPSFEYTRDTRWKLNNDTVNVDNLQDITKAGVGDISTVFYEMTGQPLIITSGTDGAGALHMDGTYSHGTGYKIDVSGNGLDDPDLRHAFIEYCESKGIRVLDEYENPSANSTGGHLDLEFHGYNGAGSVDDYSGPVNQVMPDVEMEPATDTEAGITESDLTGQSFLEDDNGPLFADDTAKAQRDSQLENLSTEELQYMMNDEERAEYEQKAAKIAQKAAKNNPYGIPMNLEKTMQAQRNAALDILHRRKVGTAIPVNRSNTNYPVHNRQQMSSQKRNVATPYSKQVQDGLRAHVAGMDDAALADAYRNAKDIPTRQIVVDELQNRIDNANNAARQTGAQQEAPTTPLLLKQEADNTQQQQSEGPSMTATRVARSGHGQQESSVNKGRYDANEEKKIVNAYADTYQNNPDAWRNEISVAKQNVDTALANGEMSKEQAEQSKANLNNLYFKVQGELDRRKGNRQQPNQAPQQSNVQSGTPSMNDVLARARKAGIKDGDVPDMLDTAIRAAMGDQRAKKRFDGWKPEIKQALADILSGNIERSNREAETKQNKPEQEKSAQDQNEERSNENGKTQLQKSETSENRNQNQHAEPGQVEQKKNTDGQAAEKQSENVNQEEPKSEKAEPPKTETREEKAERLINEAFKDDDERDMAMACFFDNMENPLQALREKRKALQEQFDELVQNAYNALARTLPKDKNGKPTGAGVNLVRKSDDSGYIRESQNPLWYQNDYKNGEKTPYSKKNMMNTALEMVLGERKDMSDQDALAEYDASNRELRPMFEENQRMYDNIETLNAIEPKMQEIQKELDKGENVTKAAENKKAPAKKTEGGKDNPYRNQEGKWVTSKGEIIQIADGYKTESGKDINNADSKDFIVQPNGSKDFGKITDAISKIVKDEHGEELPAGSIRLRVGNSFEGLIHAKEHENEAHEAGYSSIEDLIADVASNFTEIYKRTNKDGSVTYNLVKTGDKSKNIMNGVAPVYFELEKDNDGNYYIVITAIPKGDKPLARQIKNEHLIYRSPGLGAATAANNSAVSTQGNNNVGVTQENVPTSDSSVPTDTIPQSQQERKGEGKESAADNYQQAVEWMQKNNGGSVTGLRLALNISREDAVNLINRMTKAGIISDGDIDERRDYLGGEKEAQAEQGNSTEKTLTKQEIYDEEESITNKAERIVNRYERQGHDKYPKERALQDLKELEERINSIPSDIKDELREEVNDARREIERMNYVNVPADAKARMEFWRKTLSADDLESVDWGVANNDNKRGGYDYYDVFYHVEKEKWAMSKRETPHISKYDGELSYADDPISFLDTITQQKKPEYTRIVTKDTDQTQAQGTVEKPKAENIIQPEEVPETLRKNSTAPQAKIDDFGQKIGGARKDMYVNLEPGEKTARPKSEKKADDGLKDRPWLRDYDIKQGEDGRWILIHKPSEEARKRANTVSSWIIGIYGQTKKRPVETKTYDTREEAEHHAAIDAVSEKHRVFKRSNGDFEISRRIGGQKDYHWFALKTGFKTEKEALTYMALHPVEILQTRTSFGEADLPKPNIKGWNDARTGKAPQRLKADQNATADMFTNTFGFRGVQFGNWENQIERQSVMNAAYEGLLDLADIIGVNPKIISLNGELGLAFGARGQGLSGAVAHYEPRYTIINLTKMKGAGALAHEWLHALDHYLMIKGGIISNERRADGLLIAKNFNEHASDSDFQLKRSSLSDALKQAFLKVKNTAFYKEVVETKDETDALKWEQQARDRLDKELSDIRNYLAKERKYSSKKSPATEEQLKRFDELATKLAAADEKREWDGNYMMHVYPTMRKLSDLFKEITGRGLLKKNPGDDYKRLNYAISNLQVRRETLADAQAKTEFTKRVPSEYSRNNTTIDRGRSTEYWTKPTEMLARAFSSFVEDSAKAKGYTTDFLSYGSDNRLILFGKPFPEGEERKAINQAFHEFFKVVQTEIEQTKKNTGEIKFSVRAAAKEQPADNTRYQAAYHGSPHVFDTFSLEHVGSGEGNQVHGYGLYFAEEKSIADEYRYRLTADKEGSVNVGKDTYVPKDVWENLWIVNGKYEYLDDVQNEALQLIANNNGDVDKTISFINDVLKKQPDVKNDKEAQQFYRDLLKYIKRHKAEFSIPLGSQGQLYEVDIPENDVLLDEQKSLKEQPKEVHTGIEKLFKDIKEKGNSRFRNKEDLLSILENPESTGEEIYNALAVSLRDDKLASKLLNKYGIKGITYWGRKDGRCFVVFDDKAIQIMQRYEAAVRAHSAEIQRSVDSIIAEVKDAYPGAKDLKVNGNKITFTMPNGVNLTVNIKDQIILNAKDEAKARMSHRLTDENTGIVVEGYVRKLDNESMMVLSQESSEGTAYHEAFHTVRDWCLTEKENADLEKYYGKKAKEQGIDVEEAIADGYRDWKLARAKGKGTLFGKLYKKIMDFIDTAKAIFKGMYDVHEIYEQIESGDIWNRDSQGRFTKTSNTETDNFRPASVIMEEAKELYNTAAKKFSSITDKAVSERVKEAIQQTLDFGEGFGEILERASGKAIQQSLFSEENAEQANDVRGNTGRIPHQRNSKEIGFSLTRDLINNGFADLTGKPVKNVKQLAEIAQVLRHPGYEKMHYVYVKNGNVTFHETTTAMLPNVSNVMLEGENPASFAKRLSNNLIQSGADTVYLIHNHPSGNITPSQEDKNYTKFHADALRKSPIKFGGHVILDTTECSIISGNGRVYTHNIPEKAQIHYADNPDKPHILLNKQIDSANALIDISKKLADQSATTVFFADNRNVIRSIVQLPEEFTKMKLDRMNRYLRWLTRRSYARCAFIVTGDRNAYAAMRPLFHQGDSVVDIVLTGSRNTAGQAFNRANAYEGYKFFGIDGNTKLATKVLEPTAEYETAGTREGASLMPKQEYSSADTSLNQIPSVFKRVQWQQGTTNIDIGGGRFNTATDYMKEQGVNNIVFDPFNRDTEHNRNAFDKIKAKGDTVTVANVLNVIKEGEIRDNVILQAAKALKPDGTAYFGIYEGSGTGEGKATSKGWQNNRKTADYVAEVAKHFKDVSRKGNMIVAKEPVIRAGEKATWSMDTNPENDVRYSIREKVNNAVNPPPVQYGSDDTGFGRVTQHIGGNQTKNLLQKTIDLIKNFYFEMVDEDTATHKVDRESEKRIGHKLADNEKFYEKVRMAPAIAKGHAEKLIAGDKKHGEVVKSRIKNETLKPQFNAEATLKNVIDTVADKEMNSKYGDFLEKHKMRDWTQVLETHLAAWRLKEMYNMHLENWRAEHEAWRKRREDALSRGETFREREPVYKPYKLPGKLTIQDINAAIKAAPPEVEQAAQLYYAFNKNLTILLADAGLISVENFKLLNNKYQRYCPLMRDFSDTAAADDFIEGLTRGGKGPVNVSNPLKRISEEGSHRNLLSPLQNSIKACAIYCDRAERNKVGQMAVEMAGRYKLDDMIWRAKGTAADAKNCIFTVMQNGKKVAYQCLPELYAPIVGYNESDMGSFLKLATIPARVLRAGATLSPTFALRNAIRDTFFAGIASKNGFVPIYDTIRGAIALAKKPEMRAQFEAMGVGMYSFYGNEMTSTQKLDDLNQFRPPEDALDIIKKWLWDKPIAGLEWFSEKSEQATRMGEFQRALENGKSLEEAARDARNVTVDFSRHGHTGKVINRYIPFFNACIQGGDLMRRLLHEDFVGTCAKLAKYIVAPSIALWLFNHDKDWWKELDPDLKNAYWFLETPAGIIRFPKPQEAGVVFGSFFEALLDQAMKRDPDAMKNWAKASIDVITPGVQFTLITPLLENYANFSYFRKNPIVGQRNQRLPGEQQYTSGTSELSKMLGASALAHAYNKGGYSPSKIDNLVRGYTGTLGIIAWQAAGEGVRKAQGQDNNSPAKNWQEMPFAREFFANDYNLNRSLNEFYEMASAAQAQHNGYGRKGHPTAAVQAVTKARNAIADERKEIQKITDSKRITPERKQELIKMKRDKINRIATTTLKRYRDKF